MYAMVFVARLIIVKTNEKERVLYILFFFIVVIGVQQKLLSLNKFWNLRHCNWETYQGSTLECLETFIHSHFFYSFLTTLISFQHQILWALTEQTWLSENNRIWCPEVFFAPCFSWMACSVPEVSDFSDVSSVRHLQRITCSSCLLPLILNHH